MIGRAALMIVALALAACEARIGETEEKSAEAAPAAEGSAAGRSAAAGKAEEGVFSIDTPGFALKMKIPEGIRRNIGIESEADLLYPGAALGGLHVQGEEGGRGGVELRFASSDDPAKVAQWYRDPEAKKFNIVSSSEEAGSYRIAAEQTDGGDPFEVRLAPAAGGGTDGRIVLQDRR